MPSIDSPPDCNNCVSLREKVAELEGRVSTLYQIKDSERLLDQLSADQDSASRHHDTPACPKTSSPLHEDEWPHLGARPKVPRTTAEPWINITKKRGRNTSSINPPPLTLGNSFDPLSTITETTAASPLAKRTRPNARRQGAVSFTPNPHRSSRGISRSSIQPDETDDRRGNPSQRYANNAKYKQNTLAHREANAANTGSTDAIQAQNSRTGLIAIGNAPGPDTNRGNTNTTPQTDTILIGDTMTKHVKLAKTENICLSNTSVKELSSMLPTLINKKQHEPKIIIHAGSFDVLYKKTGSEELKEHFTLLLDTLSRYQDVSISGPIACFRRGIAAFSRLLNFNTWLAAVCHVRKLRFIDNFNIFWNCADRFQADGFHPNRRGSSLLSANINHALVTSSTEQCQGCTLSTLKAGRGTKQNDMNSLDADTAGGRGRGEEEMRGGEERVGEAVSLPLPNPLL